MIGSIENSMKIEEKLMAIDGVRVNRVLSDRSQDKILSNWYYFLLNMYS